MYRWITIVIVLFVLPKNSAAVAPAQNKIYMVLASGNAHRPGDTFQQTGFRLQGTRGLITALHGVAGATSIRAFGITGDALTNLHISSVDVDHDLALLSPQNWNN